MKQLIITIALLFSIVLFSQDKDLYVLNADSTWLKEITKFPFGFAPDIHLRGYEDLRFTKDWGQPESEEFFTYAFVWNTNLAELPTEDMLETNMRLYYDGLMAAVNKDDNFNIPKTIASLRKKEDENFNYPKFTGTINVHDSFFTRKVITLFVDIQTSYCKNQNKYLIFFKVSSLNFQNKIWKKLQNITLSSNICDVSSY